MTQTTTTVAKKISPRKPAAKVEAKPARKAVSLKAEAKPSLMKEVAVAATKFFVFIEGARPVSGIRLSAHTDAALRFLGLAEQKSVRKGAAIAVMGNRAIKYHIERGNMEEKGGNVALTTQGYGVFKGRVEGGKVDGKLSAAYLAAISKGKTNVECGIKDNHLIPVGMQLR